MKILFMVEAMGGGVFTYIVDLANRLVLKHDVYIAYAVRPQTPADYKDFFDKSICLIEVENFTRTVKPAKDIKAFFEIRKIAADINPDIIHLHSSKVGVLGRWAFDGKKTPLFYTPHGYSFLMKDQSSEKRLLYKTIEAVSAKRFCTTISCSEGEHQETLKLTRRATYVNNGINIEQLDELLSGIKVEANHPFTVFTLGRICYQKNPKQFNDIAKALPEVHFLWIGDGELRKELNAPNIEISGWLDRKDALTRAVASDAFLLTSLWEGLPISLLEAMYMRKPCVVSDVIGNHDVIHTGENGYVCRELPGYVEAIQECQVGKAVNLVQSAYEDILKQYNTVVMADRYVAIYDKALREIRGGYQLADIYAVFLDGCGIACERAVA